MSSAQVERRLVLRVAYWGPAYRGFQSQRGGGAVQDVLEAVFQKITGLEYRLHGAGRTDAGVHATGQVVHFPLPEGWRMTAQQWRDGFNANLPPTLRVLAAGFRRAPWHARYSAIEKTYRYELCFAPVLPPARHQLAWQVYPRPDLPRLRAALNLFVGEHDFSAFSPRRLAEGKSGVRCISRVRLREIGLRGEIEFTGNGFLYKMVRMMVGTAVWTARGKLSLGDLEAALAHPRVGAFSIVAPAHGLSLCKVRYRVSAQNPKVEAADE
jgi:tRNA pseudouridine38-40 synthase